MEKFIKEDFSDIDYILIKSERMSFLHSEGIIRIYKDQNAYIMECRNDSSYNSNHIDLKKVEVLVSKIINFERCLFETKIGKNEFLNYEYIMRWLRKYEEFREISEINIQESILNKLKDNKYLKNKAINKYFKKLGGSDNYPHIFIEVGFKTGNVISIESSVKRELMLPWTITIDNKKYVNCNLNINLAIVDLMPKGFTNRRLILGEKYFAQLLQLNIGMRF